VTPNDGPDAAAADPDQPHRPDVAGSSRRADAPPGSVAAEAALLADLLAGRGWSNPSRMPSGRVRGEQADGAPLGHDHAAGPGSTAGDPIDPEATSRPDGPAAECTCGGTTPAACRVCPVCQLIAFVQQVSPDTIEKVADFVGFAATALRDLAAAQRERRAEPSPGSGNDGTDRTDRTDGTESTEDTDGTETTDPSDADARGGSA